MLIDFHTHAFPDAIAGRTMTVLAATAGYPPATDGTLDGLRRVQAAFGVTHSVVQQIATKPSQQTSVNNWAAASQNEAVSFFGSVHPAAEDALDELVRIRALGLKGVKLHPDYQGFFVDDEAVFPLYEKTASLGLPLLFHAGQDPFSPTVVHAEPAMIARVAKAFPTLTIVAAHLGGIRRSDAVETELVGLPNVFLDLSMAHDFCPVEQAERIVKTHGADRILFASDLPWGTADRVEAFFAQMHLSPDERDAIRFGNACRLLCLDVKEDSSSAK